MSSIIYMRILGYTTVILIQCGNGIYMLSRCREELMKDPGIKDFLSLQNRYFTVWTLFIQIFYSIIGFYCDILVLKNARIKGYQLPKQLKGFKDTLFSAVAFPSTFMMCSIFWSLSNYDRNLILPAYADRVMSRTSNHIVHTVVIPLTLWEMIYQPRTVPKSHKLNVILNSLYFIAYISMVHYTYYERGIWIYPFFNTFYGSLNHLVFLAGLHLLFAFFYFIQWPLTRFFWECPEKSTIKIK